MVKKNPIILKNKSINDQKELIRNFFWSLHSDINIRNNKVNIIYSELTELYKDIPIAYHIKQYEKILQVVFQYNEVSLMSWKNWYSNYIKLQHIYGI